MVLVEVEEIITNKPAYGVSLNQGLDVQAQVKVETVVEEDI